MNIKLLIVCTLLGGIIGCSDSAKPSEVSSQLDKPTPSSAPLSVPPPPTTDTYISKLKIDAYKLIGIIHSNASAASQAIIKINNEKTVILRENQFIDDHVKVVKIESNSVLLALKENVSDIKILYLSTDAPHGNNGSTPIVATTPSSANSLSKASYMEDAFRESFLKFKNSTP